MNLKYFTQLLLVRRYGIFTNQISDITMWTNEKHEQGRGKEKRNMIRKKLVEERKCRYKKEVGFWGPRRSKTRLAQGRVRSQHAR